MILFKPWARFEVIQDPLVMKKYFSKVGRDALRIFQKGLAGSHSGRRYGSHVASAPGEYPASDSGGLAGSASMRADENSVELMADVPYAVFLRYGTRKMARRKMLDTALEEALSRNPFEPGEWVHFGKRRGQR